MADLGDTKGFLRNAEAEYKRLIKALERAQSRIECLRLAMSECEGLQNFLKEQIEEMED